MLKVVAGANSGVYREGKKHCGCCKRNLVIILAAAGFVFIVGGVVCAITKAFEKWVEHEIKKEAVLKPGNEIYRKWLHPESPIYKTYYMFNVTNPDEVLAGEVPNVQQLGPYTYRMFDEKDVRSRNKYTGSSITYVLNTYYVYDKSKSCRTCDPIVDTVTNINLPFLTTIEVIIKAVKERDSSVLWYFLEVMDNTFQSVGLKAFQTLTVHQLLWGHKDPALTKAHGILLNLARTRDPTINITLPETFALQENNTAGLRTIDSGEDDVDRVGEVLKWNKKEKISCWNSKYANMINGTGGLRFKPFISKSDEVSVFVSDVFRSFKLIYDSIVRVRGIRLYRFGLEPRQFLTGDIDGDNIGFCVTGKEKKCLPSGVMDLSNCHPLHSPIVISLPHFYLGNKSLLSTVKGLWPRKYVHGTFIDIEPHTGLTMQGNRRIQVNVAVRKISGITAFQNSATVYLPLMYVNKNGRISEDDADDFKEDVRVPLRLAEAAPFFLIGFGSILLLMASLLSYHRHRNNGKKAFVNWEEELPLLVDSGALDKKTYGIHET